ncbi:hypothetical protein ACWDG9_19155 [Streptomyces sp. NPDC001073]
MLGSSGRRPIRDPRLFVWRGFRAGAIAFMSQFLAVVRFTFVGPQFLQLIHGYSLLQGALAFLPVATVVLPVSQLTLPACPGSPAASTTGPCCPQDACSWPPTCSD